MTDMQALTSTILGAAGIIGGAVKWASSQLTKTQDRAIAALIRSAEGNTVLAMKFDVLTSRFEALTARFDHIVEILLANGIGIGLTAVAKLGRAPTAPLPVTRVISEDQDSDGDDD